ncbi:MAG: hypothetical protein INR65_06380 [Gluconacetobacter diazotrophicus]|nr:hypothetical protein [Gluconacetobacter diazotrophicus]
MAKLERMDDRPTGHASRFDKVDGQLDAIRTDVSVNMLAILAESRRARHDREEPVDTNELLRQALEQITRRRIDVDDLKRRAA